MTAAAAMSTIDQVLSLARRGWKLFPVFEPAGDGCACGKADCSRVAKHPRVEHGLKEATDDPAQLKRWWARWPSANVGLATGSASGLFVIDIDGPAGDLSLKALELRHGALPPTLVATSGRTDGGRHLYFRAPEGHVTNKADALGVGVDVRGDGGYVILPPSTHASGRSYVWVGAHEPAESPPWLTKLVVRQAPAAAAPRPKLQVVGDGPSAYTRARAYLSRLPESISGSGGHDALFEAAAAMVRGFGLTEAEALELLISDFNPRCQPAWSQRELEHKVRDAANNSSREWGYLLNAARPERTPAKAPAAPPPPPAPPATRPRDGERPPPSSSRPVIEITTEEHQVNDAAVEALGRDPTIFKRSGSLVRVVRDNVSADKDRVARPPDAPRILPFSPPLLRERLTACAQWMKWSKTEKDWVPAHPPDWTVPAVHQRGEWPSVRPIEGVVETPVLRPDGSILEKPGYDPATRLLFEPTIEFLPVPSNPTRQDANKAALELLEVVADFPFETSEHAAAWAAALLTPLAREAFHGPTPMFVADANAPGSGKTLLMDAIASIAQGRPFARTTNCDGDVEWKKQITSIALAADPMILIDNVTGRLGSPSLDAVLTGTTWSDRVLGSNEKPNIRLATIWYASANNVVLGGDLFRRVLHIRLHCTEENPENRTNFRHKDLLGWVRQERPRLVRAALTILRAYCAAGRPDMGIAPWGSYEEWVKLIPSALVFAGFQDPTRTRQSFTEVASAEVGALRNLVMGLANMGLPSMGYTVREILTKLDRDSSTAEFNGQPDPHAALRAALDEFAPAQPGKPYDARKVGKQLQKYRRRVVGGVCIERAGDNRDGVARWTVASATGAEGSAGSE